MRKPKLIYYNDSRHYHMYRYDPPMSLRQLRRPVDDILETIKDSLPEIRRQANVSALISKWDKKALRRYRSAERVDVTDLMVQPFNPNEKKLKTIEAMKGRPPVPLWRLNLMMAAGGC